MTTGSETTTGMAHPKLTPARFKPLRFISLRLDALINSLLPLGYEDADGFHYGPEPRDTGAAKARLN